MMKWWKDNSELFTILHRHAADVADELSSRIEIDRMAQEEGACPSCTRPADFWPDEMHEVRDAIYDRIEDVMLAEEEARAEEQAQDDSGGKVAGSAPADGCGGGCGGGCGDETATALPTPLTNGVAGV